ncbi:MBL fold metallo-hydrolase [Actinokineospora iranica]|uniref:L-ascorbate metabolism protein UlaG, beta-lactamase superfamily n=1 Tax=Actinokineospora iranica TaxID=1271860 RepID=A0A1G6Q9U0_9PSEU|nr:MBL fold metallo-hydrolase [Actinokineospora iranica]SDC88664.1 L-ascorbate metabolism protein UlaG, beta-lactamase superfamily [Actinokineospora iranica]
MKATHFAHSCVLLETGGARLLLDPGIWSTGFEDLRDLDAVLITHRHPDHFDLDRLAALLAANQHAELVVGPGTDAEVAEAGLAARTVAPGDALEVAGVAVTVVGGEHASIHPEVEVPPNVGFVVGHGAFYHPGDSLVVPEQAIDVLGLPTGAPWLKLSEAVEFFRAVAPRVAVPIHERTLSAAGIGVTHQRFHDLAPKGATVNVLPKGETVDLG